MRKKDREITDKKTIEKILSNSTICRIAMMDKNRPYILPFNYGYSNNCLYIHSAPEGKKIDLLKNNNKVCFEIEYKPELIKNEQACKWTTSYHSIVGYGEIKIINDFEQKKTVLDILMAQHGAPKKMTYNTKQVESIVILKLIISSLTAKRSGNWVLR